MNEDILFQMRKEVLEIGACLHGLEAVANYEFDTGDLQGDCINFCGIISDKLNKLNRIFERLEKKAPLPETHNSSSGQE